MSKTNTPQPPKHLSPSAKQFWRAVVESFDIEEHAADLLLSACVQLQRAEEARVVIAKEGMVVKDRFGQPKQYPAVELERQTHLAFLRIGRELGLTVDAPDSRPPLGAGYR